jgi:nucleotide-binding universal stress UspA family protein
MKTILCAIDFSPLSEAVLRYAQALARKESAHLLLVHIVDALPVVAPGAPVQYEQAIATARKHLQDMSRDLAAGNAEIVVEAGDPAVELLELAGERKADLIVLGTHGRSGVDKLLMGSTAEEVLSMAECPTITIGPAVQLSQQPEIRRVLVPLDFSPQSLAAIEPALEIARTWDAEFFLLHVLEQPRDAAAASARLRAVLPASHGLRLAPDVRIARKEPGAGILDAAHELGADLVVLGLRHSVDLSRARTHIARTVAQKVIPGAPCPVLTVIAR